MFGTSHAAKATGNHKSNHHIVLIVTCYIVPWHYKRTNESANEFIGTFLETPRTLSEIVYEHSGYKRVFNHIDRLQKYYNEQNKKYVTKNEVAISDDKQPLMTVVEQQEYNVIWKSYVKKSPENLIQKREEVMPKEAQPPFRVYKSFEDLYRMHKALEEIKEKHKVGVQERTRKIVNALKELVERGIIRVAMEFMENRNNNNALFLFCKRRIMQPIHVVNRSMMRRGDLFVDGGVWKLVNQRRCKQRETEHISIETCFEAKVLGAFTISK